MKESHIRCPMIPKNKTIKCIQLLRIRPKWLWRTIWPFIFLYFINGFLFLLPLCYLFEYSIPLYPLPDEWTLTPCQIGFGLLPCLVFTQIFLSLMTVWSVRFKKWALHMPTNNLKNAVFVFVETNPHRGASDIVTLERDEKNVFFFTFQQIRWEWFPEHQIFMKPKYPTKRTIQAYLSTSGLTTRDAESSTTTFGLNKFQICIPEFKQLFVEHALAPFFVFQMLCVLLWCLDEYWMYSIFTGILMTFFECTVVFQRRRNMQSLRQMSEIPISNVSVLRDGAWCVLPSSSIVPGDLLILPHNAEGIPCPCDVVILNGSVVADESLLTGESTPQLKEAINNRNEGEVLSLKSDARYMVFGGTNILSSTSLHEDGKDSPCLQTSNKYRNPPTDGAIAFVLKTGFGTQQGNLLRTILHSQIHVSGNSKEALGFIGVLLLFAVAACSYVIQRTLQDEKKSRWKLLLTCIRIVTSVVPPELPMELALAVNASLMKLAKIRIFCTEPFRIPYAGKVTYCCFDKTGTLTCDDMNLEGVVESENLSEMSKNRETYSLRVVQTLVSCNSLVYSGSKCLGDSMERAALKSVQWNIVGTGKFSDEKNKKFLRILVRFPFSSVLKRMSVIAEYKHTASSASAITSLFSFAKGAPENMKSLFKVVPDDYDHWVDYYASNGYRVIALGCKKLCDAKVDDIHQLKRSEVETLYDFIGLALFSSPLKPDAQSVISHLRESSHTLTMITGDNELTSVAVSKNVGILHPNDVTETLTVHNNELFWVNSRDKNITRFDFMNELSPPLVVNGDAWKLMVQLNHKKSEDWILKNVTNVSVWARCTPDQKESVVLALKALGHHVLVAGDGTNDVAALKQAHVGLAVLNAPSPVQEGGIAEPDPYAPIPIPVIPCMPPPISEDAGFMERVRYLAAIKKREALIKYRDRVQEINAQREVLRRKASKSSSTQISDRSVPPKNTRVPNNMLLDDENTFTRLGDASIASPFTSKSSRVSAVCDILRTGRCTLVSTIQTYKILALNCLISAYSMSVLYCDGVKFGDKQMVLSGVVLSVCFLFVSRAQPLDRLSKERPITRVFCPYILLSIFLQFTVHLVSLIVAVQMVDDVDQNVRIESAKLVEDETFRPNLLNSIIFLLSTMMSVTTFAVNYRGYPFMTSLRENKPLWNSILLLTTAIAIISTESMPEFNEFVEIVPMPSDSFRNMFCMMLVCNTALCFVIDRILLFFLGHRV